MTKDFKLIATGYLYSPWAGKLREYAGEVYHQAEYRAFPSNFIVPEHTHFLAKDEHGRTIKKFDCAAYEGEMHNKVVWLSERDPHKAAAILIEHEEEQIAKLRLKIRNHEDLIESLKKI